MTEPTGEILSLVAVVIAGAVIWGLFGPTWGLVTVIMLPILAWVGIAVVAIIDEVRRWWRHR